MHPDGSQLVPGRCNDNGHSQMAWYYPEVKDSWALVTNTQMNDSRLDLFEGTVARTGEHPGCVNDFGAFDMEGNLHEWTADPNGTFQGG